MGVDVDDAGGDDEAVGVDGTTRGFVDGADRNDAAAAHTDVAGGGGCAGAVDDTTATDNEIEHSGSSQLGWSSAATAPSTTVPAKNSGLPRV